MHSHGLRYCSCCHASSAGHIDAACIVCARPWTMRAARARCRSSRRCCDPCSTSGGACWSCKSTTELGHTIQACPRRLSRDECRRTISHLNHQLPDHPPPNHQPPDHQTSDQCQYQCQHQSVATRGPSRGVRGLADSRHDLGGLTGGLAAGPAAARRAAGSPIDAPCRRRSSRRRPACSPPWSHHRAASARAATPTPRTGPGTKGLCSSPSAAGAAARGAGAAVGGAGLRALQPPRARPPGAAEVWRERGGARRRLVGRRRRRVGDRPRDRGARWRASRRLARSRHGRHARLRRVYGARGPAAGLSALSS